MFRSKLIFYLLQDGCRGELNSMIVKASSLISLDQAIEVCTRLFMCRQLGLHVAFSETPHQRGLRGRSNISNMHLLMLGWTRSKTLPPETRQFVRSPSRAVVLWIAPPSSDFQTFAVKFRLEASQARHRGALGV